MPGLHDKVQLASCGPGKGDGDGWQQGDKGIVQQEATSPLEEGCAIGRGVEGDDRSKALCQHIDGGLGEHQIGGATDVSDE
jgi:hypothetical protein